MAKAFNLTPRVREDLRAIWRYTAEICNETQADAYGSSESIHPGFISAAGSRRGSITYIRVGESTQDENVISILLQNQ